MWVRGEQGACRHRGKEDTTRSSEDEEAAISRKMCRRALRQLDTQRKATSMMWKIPESPSLLMPLLQQPQKEGGWLPYLLNFFAVQSCKFFWLTSFCLS